MKKTSKILLIIFLTMLTLTTIVYAASVSIKLEAEKQENEILLHIELDKINVDGRGISGFVADLEYDKNVFEAITEENLISENGWIDIMYNEKDGSIVALRNDFTKTQGDILVVKLSKKANINVEKTEIKLTSIQVTDAKQDIDIENKQIEIRFSGIDLGKVFLIIIIAIVIVIAFLFIIRIINNRKRRARR